jgi:hypothetical protein
LKYQSGFIPHAEGLVHHHGICCLQNLTSKVNGKHIHTFKIPVSKGSQLAYEDITVECGLNVYHSCFARRAIGCKKILMNEDGTGVENTTKRYSKRPTTCICHCVPDTVPIAFSLENLSESWRAPLRSKELVIRIDKSILDGLPKDHPMRTDTEWVVNPILAMCALRLYLQRSGGSLEAQFIRYEMY